MLNFFTLLNLPESFAVDAKLLEVNYFAAQREFHPDRVGNSFEAMQQGANLNEAYGTLKDPFKRAVHLLKLHGVDALDGQSYATPQLLQESFMMREALAETDDVTVIMADHAARTSAALEAIGQAAETQDWQKMAEAVVALKFLNTFAGEIARHA
jgi:molecular chaperone HscB